MPYFAQAPLARPKYGISQRMAPKSRLLGPRELSNSQTLIICKQP